MAYAHAVIHFCAECRGSEFELHTHDCFDHEDVFGQYEWYLLEPSETGRLLGLLEACPCHLSAECVCPVHDALRASCRSLPSSPWVGGPGVEADFHVHRAYLEVKDGLPKIRAAAEARDERI